MSIALTPFSPFPLSPLSSIPLLPTRNLALVVASSSPTLLA
ncbi:hypothetical protein PI124_g20757 [Phytophthora idaei]|nr:hypothetical protein PI125_g22214 [Phytophthora idaei]KAG3234184.1 hypothetical protein PI124_g20757 [Phytophthora idaei]